MGEPDPLLKAIEHATARLKDKDFGRPYFKEYEYEAMDFASTNFIHLPIPTESDMDKIKTSVAYIDGGNTCVYDSPAMSIHHLRAYASCFNPKGERINFSCQLPVEASLVVTMVLEEGRAELNGRLFFGRGHVEMEDTYRHKRNDVEDFVSTLRRCLELTLAYNILRDELKTGDMIVLDGSLQFPEELAHGWAKKLIETAEKKGIAVVGVSKTSRLVTSTTIPLLSAISIQHDMSFGDKSDEAWYYHPVAVPKGEKCHGDIYITRLHPDSVYAFRVDIVPGAGKLDIKDIFKTLSYHSQDLSFLGYPYGLIDADRHARISEDEEDSMRFIAERTFHQLGAGKASRIYSATVDAHDRLDNM